MLLRLPRACRDVLRHRLSAGRLWRRTHCRFFSNARVLLRKFTLQGSITVPTSDGCCTRCVVSVNGQFPPTKSSTSTMTAQPSTTSTATLPTSSAMSGATSQPNSSMAVSTNDTSQTSSGETLMPNQFCSPIECPQLMATGKCRAPAAVVGTSLASFVAGFSSSR